MTGTVAVVPAAGSGERLAAGVPKAFYQLDGRTLVERAIDAPQYHTIGKLGNKALDWIREREETILSQRQRQGGDDRLRV